MTAIGHPQGPGTALGPGQLRHPQDSTSEGLATQAPPHRAALHPPLGLLAQPRRTLVR